MNQMYCKYITCYACSEDVETEFTRCWDECGNEYIDVNVDCCPLCGDQEFMCGSSDDARASERRAMMAD
jgi:hypothetical protein